MNQHFLHIFRRRMWTLVCILLLPASLQATTDNPDATVPDSIQSVRQLDELLVDGKNGLSNKLGHVSVSAAEINRTPTLLGERDLVKTLQSRAGVVAGAEGFAGLYV